MTPDDPTTRPALVTSTATPAPTRTCPPDLSLPRSPTEAPPIDPGTMRRIKADLAEARGPEQPPGAGFFGSLSAKILVPLLIFTTLVGGIVIVQEQRTASSKLASELDTDITRFVQVLEGTTEVAGIAGMTQTVQALATDPGIEKIIIIGDDPAEVLAATDGALVGTPADELAGDVRDALSQFELDPSVIWKSVDSENARADVVAPLDVSLSELPEGSEALTGFFVLDTTEAQQMVAEQGRRRLVFTLFIVVFFAIGAWALIRWIVLGRIRQIDDALRRWRFEDSSSRVVDLGNDQLGHVATNINKALDDVDRRERDLTDTNVRLEDQVDELDRLRRREAALGGLSANLGARMTDLVAVLDVTSSEVTRILGDACFVWMSEAGEDELVLASVDHRSTAAAGFLKSLEGTKRPTQLHDELSRIVLAGGTVQLHDISQNRFESMATPAFGSYHSVVGVSSLVIQPLRTGGEARGCLWLTRDNGSPAFTEADLRLLEELAQRVELAISNALLYQEASEAATVIRASADAIGVADLEGRMRKWNPAASQLFGWSHDSPAPSLFPAQSIAGQFRERVVHDGDEVRFEEIRHRPNGEEIWCSITLSAIRDELERPVAILGIFRDTTESHEQAEALRESEMRYRALALHLEQRVIDRTRELKDSLDHLARSNRDLEQFAHVASHDLRSPLRTVRGFADLFLHHLDRSGLELDVRARDYLDQSMAGITRMEDLLRGLLSYSRVERGGQDRTAPCDLADVMDEVLSGLTQAIEQSGATVDVGALPTLPGDRTQMMQLLQNLLENALKYRHPHRKPVIEITAHRIEDEWELWVADNGIGIEADHHPHIFRMFGQLDPNTSPGIGLGLALCQRIIDRHGGRIWVESEVGVGSVFKFRLPAESSRLAGA